MKAILSLFVIAAVLAINNVRFGLPFQIGYGSETPDGIQYLEQIPLRHQRAVGER